MPRTKKLLKNDVVSVEDRFRLKKAIPFSAKLVIKEDVIFRVSKVSLEGFEAVDVCFGTKHKFKNSDLTKYFKEV